VGVIDDIKEEVKEEMKERNNDKGVLDIITEKAISRKFLVWVVSSALLVFGKIDPDNWVAITLGYVGIEGFADLAIKWKGSK
jgi:hypothetical protein